MILNLLLLGAKGWIFVNFEQLYPLSGILSQSGSLGHTTPILLAPQPFE